MSSELSNAPRTNEPGEHTHLSSNTRPETPKDAESDSKIQTLIRFVQRLTWTEEVPFMIDPDEFFKEPRNGPLYFFILWAVPAAIIVGGIILYFTRPDIEYAIPHAFVCAHTVWQAILMYGATSQTEFAAIEKFIEFRDFKGTDEEYKRMQIAQDDKWVQDYYARVESLPPAEFAEEIRMYDAHIAKQPLECRPYLKRCRPVMKKQEV